MKTILLEGPIFRVVDFVQVILDAVEMRISADESKKSPTQNNRIEEVPLFYFFSSDLLKSCVPLTCVEASVSYKVAKPWGHPEN